MDFNLSSQIKIVVALAVEICVQLHVPTFMYAICS